MVLSSFTIKHRRHFRWLPVFLVSIGLHGVWLIFPALSRKRSGSVSDRIPFKVAEVLQTSYPAMKTARSIGLAKGKEALGSRTKRRPKLALGYPSLLPSTSPSAFLLARGSEVPGSSQSAGLNVTKSARSKPLIDAFAAEVRARIDVPSRIYHVRRSGAARATVQRIAPGRWQAKVEGPDPYARAIISNALTSLSGFSFGREQLEKSDWNRVEINFSFEWRSTFNAAIAAAEKNPQNDTKVEGNRIEMTIIRFGGEEELNKNYRRALVLAPLAFGVVDFVGIYTEFIRKPEDSGPAWDPDVRRLEHSAAYVKPIVSIPVGSPAMR
jgi:hypothetical protein